jgi:BarA-like signal transduction histidine kinase
MTPSAGSLKETYNTHYDKMLVWIAVTFKQQIKYLYTYTLLNTKVDKLQERVVRIMIEYVIDAIPPKRLIARDR